jgi:hypothetical protein
VERDSLRELVSTWKQKFPQVMATSTVLVEPTPGATVIVLVP